MASQLLLGALKHGPRHVLHIPAVRQQVRPGAVLSNPGTATLALPGRTLSSSSRLQNDNYKQEPSDRARPKRTSPSEAPPKDFFGRVMERRVQQEDSLFDRESELLDKARQSGDTDAVRRHEHAVAGLWLAIEDTARQRHVKTEYETLEQLWERSRTERNIVTKEHVRGAEHLLLDVLMAWMAEFGLFRHNVLADWRLVGVGERVGGVVRFALAVTLAPPAVLLRVVQVRIMGWGLEEALEERKKSPGDSEG